MNKFLSILFSFFFIIYTHVSKGQGININNPYLINHSKKVYNGGTENWDCTTTKEGFVYYANNEGLLKFDGHKWSIYRLPNKTVVRSLAFDVSLNRIYVGGQDEVGYFKPNEKGELVFFSLKHLLPKEHKLIEDVWNIIIVGKKVVFRSVNKIFEFDQKQIVCLTADSKVINFLGSTGGMLYYGDPNKGIIEISNISSRLLSGSEVFIGQKVVAMVNFGVKKLFISERKGIFEYKDQKFVKFGSNQNLNDNILSSALVVDKNTIAIGSVLQGILFLDTLGQIKSNITKKQGLQTNSIITLIKDYNGNLWAGTTNGIDQILINSPFSVIYPDGDLQGGAYAVKIYKNKLYVGTNNGLYFAKWNDKITSNIGSFTKVKNSDGQVWALDIIGDDLLMGHNEGAFQIIKNTAIKISKEYSGTWRFISLPDNNQMIAGSYNGLQLFQKNNLIWEFVQNVKGFSESSRIIAKDIKNQFWVSHPYRGVYKLTLSNDYKSVIGIKNYGKSNGLPTNLANYIVRLKDNIYVNGETGIYKYIQEKDLFEVEKNLTSLIGNQINVRRLFQENDESIWYVNEKECGLLSVQNSVVSKNVVKKNVPFINGKLIGGFENIYAPNKSSAFVCTDRGIILIDLAKLQKSQTLHVKFTEIEGGNSIKYNLLNVNNNEEVKIKFNQNSLRISYATDNLDPTSQVKYSYLLKGYNKEWSDWSDQNFHEFNNLQPGKYTLFVKAYASYGIQSNEIKYNFEILNPWYTSKLALFSYLLLFALGIYYLMNYLNKKHEEDKIKLKEDKEVSEAKIKILENEKMQAEIDYKNRELALLTMHVLQKNETLTKLREELNQAVKQAKEVEVKSNIKKVISILSDDKKLEDDWESFAIHFDSVHTDFLKRLKSGYPNLSPKDLKLCAYLRMNMTTKDIAPLLNISVRGVEISRYRLRKKMDIPQETNLNDFMMNF